MQYRSEIDGLRAIAVLSVVVFHFFPSLLPLGYLGVDIFFVLSGFLISVYILSEFKKGQFSFRIFYHRRFKRIMPATLVMLSISSIVALFILTPPDLKRLAYSVLSSITFVANIFFWRDGGYFGLSNELKPLLHMWSLGVEEQFYIFFPLFLFIAYRFTKMSRALLRVLLSLCLLSVFVNAFLIIKGGGNPAFFLLPARVWQFACGAIAAYYFLQHNGIHRRYHLELAIILVLIGLCFSHELAIRALVVSGSVAYILAKSCNSSYGTRLLSNSFLVKIGLISFSIYLWHWPIVVYLKYYFVEQVPIIWMLAGIALTFILSAISYKWVETPFRLGHRTKMTYGLCFSLIALLGGVSVQTLFQDGFKNRATPFVNSLASASQSNYHCNLSDYIPYGNSRACHINKEAKKDYTLALVGNSHAQMYVPAIESILASQGITGLLIPLNSCLPTIDVNLSKSCLKQAQANFNAYTNDPKLKTVVLALTWSHNELVAMDGQLRADPKKEILAYSLLNLIEKIEQAGKKVYLVGPILTPKVDLASQLSRKLFFQTLSPQEGLRALKTPRHEFDAVFENSLTILSERLDKNLILPGNAFCDDESCYFGTQEQLYFADNNHLSRLGALKTQAVFKQAFSN